MNSYQRLKEKIGEEAARAQYREYVRARRARDPERVREVDRRHAEKNREKIREQERARYWRDPEKFRARAKSYLERNPEKYAARIKLREALYRGDLTRPKWCPECGGDGRIEAHHLDYTKPLEVEWLCRKCHRRKHRLPVGAPLQTKQTG